ncbi:hypothetical protein OsJ_19265 [Oryza sativa Japonica Group]|uniref:Malectin-like domain-containing protein n=1 Tax=Oryza sativa subsp. japonica TaxID=39947 RepID=B9FL85_ORYSJ|nr:hypothetical protein OsJ_19265 [Oryza sativa Japonica Group]
MDALAHASARRIACHADLPLPSAPPVPRQPPSVTLIVQPPPKPQAPPYLHTFSFSLPPAPLTDLSLANVCRCRRLAVGFISVDCGLPGKTSYVDDKTKISYAADDGFTDGGSFHNISAEYFAPALSARYYNVRSFPDGARNCYTLRSLVAGHKYLIRATFMYGNYDGLSKLPIFDVYIGVNFWMMVNITDPAGSTLLEAIVVVPDDFVQVCLVNTGTGTPFISGLDLRPLKKKLYPQATETQGLSLFGRWKFGPTSNTEIIR